MLIPPMPPKPAYNVISDAPHTSAGLWDWLHAVGAPWTRIGLCESWRDGSWRASSDSPARGVFQMLPSTWASLGQTGDPASYSWRFQLHESEILAQRDGLEHSWVCAR